MRCYGAWRGEGAGVEGQGGAFDGARREGLLRAMYRIQFYLEARWSE